MLQREKQSGEPPLVNDPSTAANQSAPVQGEKFAGRENAAASLLDREDMTETWMAKFKRRVDIFKELPQEK